MACAWRNFKNIFSRLLFIINFRMKILISDPYSILTGSTMVEFLIYCILTRYLLVIQYSWLDNTQISITLGRKWVDRRNDFNFIITIH